MYRLSRNVEASLKDYITEELQTDGWTGIFVELIFKEIYGGKFPSILINVSERPDARREIGSDSLNRYVNIELRIFANDDGQRLDLSDWLLEKIMSGVPYYIYTIAGGGISQKNLAGRISALELTVNRKELANTDTTAKEDRYRHLLAFRCRVALS